MAATSLHKGYQLPGLTNRTWKLLDFLQIRQLTGTFRLDLVPAGLLPLSAYPS